LYRHIYVDIQVQLISSTAHVNNLFFVVCCIMIHFGRIIWLKTCLHRQHVWAS